MNAFYSRVQHRLQTRLPLIEPKVFRKVKRGAYLETISRWFKQTFPSLGHIHCTEYTHHWWFTDKLHAEYWTCYASTFHESLRLALVEGNLELPVESDVVIHIRLGDIPFVFHYCYHLQYYHYYEWALRRLVPSKKSCVIILVYSFKWLSDRSREKHIKFYLDDLVAHLKSEGHNVKLQSSDVLTDFATMFFAKNFIGSKGSFSFVACMGRDPSTFCMPMLGVEKRTGTGGYKRSDYKTGQYTVVKPIPEWMYSRKPLLHYTVVQDDKSYEDVDYVCARLQEK